MHTRASVWKRTLGSTCAFLFAIAAGCSDQAPLVRIVDVPDGTYLRGMQVSTLDIDLGLDVVRSELYLDGLRVAADDFAPFELGWDTRRFDEGPHVLTARVYVITGEHVDGTSAIVIDNTPPTVGSLPSTASGDQAFTLNVSDNFKVAKVEVTRDVQGEAPVVLTTPPFRFAWAWGCGKVVIHVRVFDAAGGEASATTSVTAIDGRDSDCDGFRGKLTGGTDCNDSNAQVHPGAAEPPEGFDLNCDGVTAPLAGIDFDGDGVPSIADGGTDCNDTDAAIHGDLYRFAHAEVHVNGVPISWSPGDAALQAFVGSWQLFLNRAGVIESYAPGFNGDAAVRQLASGANPSSLWQRNDLLAFGRGNDVVILERGAVDWREHGTIHAAGPVTRLLVDRSGGIEYAIFQAGTTIGFASSANGGASWTTEVIDDLHEPLVENPSGFASPPDYALFAVRTSHGVWTYVRSQGQAFMKTRMGPADKAPTAMTDSGSPLIAVNDGNGSAVYMGNSTVPLLRTPTRVTAMATRYPSTFLQLEGGGVEVYMYSPSSFGLRHTQSIPDIGAFDTVGFDGFAGGGFVHYLTGMSIFTPIDPIDDHVDRNCDERD